MKQSNIDTWFYILYSIVGRAGEQSHEHCWLTVALARQRHLYIRFNQSGRISSHLSTFVMADGKIIVRYSPLCRLLMPRLTIAVRRGLRNDVLRRRLCLRRKGPRCSFRLWLILIVANFTLQAQGCVGWAYRGSLARNGIQELGEGSIVCITKPSNVTWHFDDTYSVFKFDKTVPGGFKWGFQLDNDPDKICFAKLYVTYPIPFSVAMPQVY